MSRVIRCFQSFVTNRTDSSEVAPGEPAYLREGEAESRVGRKLSERTTTRVIVLVLVMLVVVPQLQQSEFTVMMDPGAQYGANVLLEAWRQYELTALESPQAAALLDQKRWEWELEMLTYIYYHNWHAEACPTSNCASEWLDKLCWVGFVHRSDAVLDAVDVTSQAYIKAIAESGTEWDTLLADGDPHRRMGYAVGSLPENVKAALSRPWDAPCDEAGSSSRIQGVSLIPGLPCPRQELRKQETVWYVPQVYDKAFFVNHMEAQFVLVYDLRDYVRAEANFNILQTAFVVLVLGIAALLFSRDVDRLVLHPIEKMIRKVEIIRKDPLYAIKLGDLEPSERDVDNGTRTLSLLSLVGWPRWRRLPGWPLSRRADDEGTPKSRRSKTSASSRRSHAKITSKERSMETKILENAIIKLGSLLALGFGEAGVEIIGQNLDDENATVDAMIPGSKVEAIYGWCDIRNFAVVTEVLQGKTMVFVNQVAAIVHRIVDEHLGAANKNAGQAFLMVWRLEQHLPTGGTDGPGSASSRERISDLAVMSFVRVVMELARDSSLAEYRTHPWLLAKLPKFRVRLGFGLHLGWSIEGAIGSAFKIDASYLSPHVNVAVQLEEMTVEYDVKILMSEPLVRSCNPRFSRHFRPVDRVQLPGSKTIARLFTVDLDDTTLRVQRRPPATGSASRSQRRQDRETEKQRMLVVEQDREFERDRFIRQMRRRHTQQFFQEYERGYLNYEAGEWDVAREALQRTMLLPRKVAGHLDGQPHLDGPSNVLLTYMEEHSFKAPEDWKGWRRLDRKTDTFYV